MTPSPLGAYNDPEHREPPAVRPGRAKELMAEAGYADGFEVTLDCPNNRYINDEEICIALAGMWAQFEGARCRVNAMPRATYFPKLEKLDTSMYMFGWGGAITDAETTLTPVMRNRGRQGRGLIQLRQRHATTSSTRWPRSPASRPTPPSASNSSRRRCASTRTACTRSRCTAR